MEGTVGEVRGYLRVVFPEIMFRLSHEETEPFAEKFDELCDQIALDNGRALGDALGDLPDDIPLTDDDKWVFMELRDVVEQSLQY